MCFSEVRGKVGVKCCDECLTSLCRELQLNSLACEVFNGFQSRPIMSHFSSNLHCNLAI